MKYKVFYLYLQKRLHDSSNCFDCVSYKEVMIKMSKMRIPKVLFPVLLKELEEMGLIEIINKNNYRRIKINKCKEIKLLNKINKLYNIIGIY